MSVYKKTATRFRMQPFRVEAGGIETVSVSPCGRTLLSKQPRNTGLCDAVDDAIPADLAELIALWPGLPSEVKAEILRLAQQAQSAAKWPE